MSSFSNYLENELLDHVFGGTDYARPATLHIALFTTNPNFETGAGGTEVTGGSYTRASTTNNDTNFPAASGGAKTTGAAINFATPTANWGTVTGFGVYDASTAGNLLAGAAFSSSKTINSGDAVTFAAGDIDITLD